MKVDEIPHKNYFLYGVVVGKFWPPHSGHMHLIKTAAEHCSMLEVFVIESVKERPDGEQRKHWIEEYFRGLDKSEWESKFSNINVTVVPNLPPGYEDDSVAWADYTMKLLDGIKPDAVFTSEEYGHTWAEALGCEHVCVDIERSAVPVSGTLVRQNAMAVWDHIPDTIRPYYAKKVLILGGESTGKTTLAKRLAEHYNAPWVEEYGRTYCETFGIDTQDPAIWPMIVKKQPELEDKAAIESNGLIICDTDLLTTSVWYKDWVGVDDMYRLIQTKGMARNYDVVLVLDYKDVPWVQDGTRVAEDKREWFHQELLEVADHINYHFTVIRGDWDNRFKVAVETVDAYLESLNVGAANTSAD
jgi:HTH-type transcriptional repressor of NAD biosynthesis genes